MTLHQLLNEGTRKLERAGDREAALDARGLLLEAFRLDMVHFLMNRMESLEETRAVEEAAADMIQLERELYSKSEDDYLEELKAKGVNITYPDREPFKEASQKAYEQFAPNVGGMDKIEAVINYGR